MILTVDVLITINQRQVILIERAKPPFMDKLVMPGGHVEQTDVSLKKAATRELGEEIGLKIHEGNLQFLTILDHPERDPRGRIISVVYHLDIQSDQLSSLKAGSDAKCVVIKDLVTIKADEIGFDHYQAISQLQRR